MDRRSFLSSAALAGASVPTLRSARAAPSVTPPGLVDTNVYSSHWTTRHSWVDATPTLADRLRRHGVTSAWVGSFEGVLHTDIAGANLRLAETCGRSGDGLLVAFGTVNPTLPDWEDDLRRCHEIHRMPGIRLFPAYHGYALDDGRLTRLIDLSSQRRRLVQIVVSIEDERSQNPMLTAAPVQLAPLGDLVQAFPAARLMLLNSTSRLFNSAPLLQRLAKAGVLCEIATLENVAGIEALLQRVPELRLCFGSHSPYFYFEAALLKLQESDLSPAQLAAVTHAHAAAALKTA